jgi:hypothetical protein
MVKRNRNNQNGVGSLPLLFGLTLVFLVVAIIFGAASFSKEQDYKNNVDAKIATAVTAAKQQQSAADTAANAKANELPLRTYNGPEAYGSLVVSYPKTWSAYVDDTGGSSGSSNVPVDGYFDPGTVPSISSNANSVFALRVQVLNQAYSQVLSSFSSQFSGGSAPTITTYSLPKVPQAVGVEVNGALSSNGNNPVTGTMVVLPLRADTLEIWTEGTQYISDFNNNILPNFSFSP